MDWFLYDRNFHYDRVNYFRLVKLNNSKGLGKNFQTFSLLLSTGYYKKRETMFPSPYEPWHSG